MNSVTVQLTDFLLSFFLRLINWTINSFAFFFWKKQVNRLKSSNWWKVQTQDLSIKMEIQLCTQLPNSVRCISHNILILDFNSSPKTKAEKIPCSFPLGQDKIAELLIENGADINGANDYGKAPIHLASQRGNLCMSKTVFKNTMITLHNNTADTLIDDKY